MWFSECFDAFCTSNKVGDLYSDEQNLEAQRRWRKARASITAQLPSAQLHHSREGTVIGRRNMTKNRQRKASVGLALGVNPNRRPTSANAMEMKLMDEANRRGLTTDMDGDDDYDEIDRLKQIDLIREMPVPLQAKRDIRERLLKTMPEVADSGCSGWLHKRKMKAYLSQRRGKKQWKEVGQYLILWRDAFNRIEGLLINELRLREICRIKAVLFSASVKRLRGHQGSSVLTYFTFLKWLFIVNLVIFFIVFIFLIIPMIAFTAEPYNTWVIANSSSSTVTTVNTCSAIYESNITISQDAGDLILNFIDGTGWMENTAMFYGFYVNKLVSFTSGYGYSIPMAYMVVMLVYLLFSLLVIVGKTSYGFRERLFSGASAGNQFCNLVFAAWDFTIQMEETAELRYKTFTRSITGELRERERRIKIKSRTTKDKAKLYTIRIFLNLLILASLGGAGYLIYFSTVKTVEIESSADYASYNRVVKLLVQYLTSITITVLNAILPTIYKMVVRFEHYSPSAAVSFTLFRTVFLKLASLAILLLSIYSKVTCTPQDECRVGTGTCSIVRCWETKVGQEMYKLTLMDFFVLIGVTLCVELPRWLIVTKCTCKLAKKIPRQEFDISKEVLVLIYGQTLLWFGTFFCPLIPVIAVLKNFIGFYVKYLSSMIFYGPSTKPHSASDSDAFFMYVLLVAYVLCVLPIGYCIWMIAPSRSCGPFRLYNKMYDILDYNLTTYPQWLQDMVSFVQSSIFEFTAIVVLCVVIFYLYQVVSAYKAMSVMLKEQLAMEAHDKKFLLEKIQELSGVGPPKPALYANKTKTTPPQAIKSSNSPIVEDLEDVPNGGLV